LNSSTLTRAEMARVSRPSSVGCASAHIPKQTDGLPGVDKHSQPSGQTPAFASPAWQRICVHAAPAGKGAQIGALEPQSLDPTVSEQALPKSVSTAPGGSAPASASPLPGELGASGDPLDPACAPG
jgi:hypothetical protein